jgi:hypothetical protein
MCKIPQLFTDNKKGYDFLRCLCCDSNASKISSSLVKGAAISVGE